MATAVVALIVYLLAVAAALSVRALAIMGIYRMSLTVLATGTISFWQALGITCLLLLATFDLSAEYKKDVKL